MKTSAQPLAATHAPSQPADSRAQADQRPVATMQRQLQAEIAVSPRQVAQRQAQADLAASPRQQALASAPAPNRTGLPDALKAGVEHLSGHALDDVRVHYNSAQPAAMHAHAFAQGTDIHLAPGQHQHLPHEAWHVAQQKQGRVRPTTQLKGISINDDSSLEQEADQMGQRALMLPAPEAPAPTATAPSFSPGATHQLKLNGFATGSAFIQFIEADHNLPPDIREIIRMPEVQNIINAVAVDPAKWNFHSLANPTLRVDDKKRGGKAGMKTHEELVRWVRLLGGYFSKQVDSETGYAPDHSAQVSITNPHKSNWLDFVYDHLHELHTGQETSAYNKLLDDAQDAAIELDKDQTKSKGVAFDPGPHIAIINKFAAYIDQNKGASKVKPLLPTWKTEGRFGTGLRVQAHYEPGTTFPKGSGVDITTPLDWFYSGRLAGTSAHYVKGHLLNDHVGGPARNYNLSPLEATRNKEHEAGIEHYLKHAVRLMTQEWENKQQPTFARIEYTTELGPQGSPRDITLRWQAAEHFWRQQAGKPFYKTTPLSALLTDPTVPDSVKHVTDNWPALQKATMEQSFPWVNAAAQLLETEDVLVRDWDVHLLLVYTEGSQETHFVHLANGKQEKVELKAGLPVAPVDVRSKVTDTEALTPTRPTAIKRLLHELPEGQRQDFMSFVARTELALFNVTDGGMIENHPGVALSLWQRYQADTQQKNLQLKIQGAVKAIGEEVSLEVINELAKRFLNGQKFSTIYEGIYYLRTALEQQKQEQHVDYFMQELNRSRLVVQHQVQQEQERRARQEQEHQAQQEQERRAQAASTVVSSSALALSGHQRENEVNYLPQLSHTPEQPTTPTSLLLENFRELLHYEAGKQMLQQASYALSYKTSESPMVRMGAWAMLLGQMLGTLKSERNDLVAELLDKGAALLQQAHNEATKQQQPSIPQELQDYIPYLAQLLRIEIGVVIAALNNPNEYQNAIQQLQQAKNHYQQQRQ